FEQARYAATLVRVEYDPTPPVVTMKPDAPPTFPDKFLGREGEELQKTRGGDAPAVRVAFDGAAVRVSENYKTPIEHHNPIEMSSTIAVWRKSPGDGASELTLYDTCRNLKGNQTVIAQVFGLPPESVRIVSHFVGGSFGAKGFSWNNPILCALAAKSTNRTVKMSLTRQQMLLLAGQRAATEQRYAIGATADGTIQAVRHEARTHSSVVSGYIEPCGRTTKSIYPAPFLELSTGLIRLNLPSPCPMRAPGEAAGTWVQETALDELAEKLAMDPLALRLHNHADVDPDNGKPWSSKHLKECYARGAELIGWAKRNPKPRSTPVGRYLEGYGMATTIYPSGQNPAEARVILSDDGRAVVQSATHDQGNGAYTIFAQIAADALGLPLSQVRFDLGDTAFPFAPPTGGSTATVSVGAAIEAAAVQTKRQLAALATGERSSPLFGATPESLTMAEGRLVLSAKPEQGETYVAILKRAGQKQLTATAGAKPGAEREKHSISSFGALFAKVRVDPELGTIRVQHIVGVFDIGRVINPQTAESQFHGGIGFGIGMALCEETVYDPRNGRAAMRGLADYHVPSMADTPRITVEALNIPDPQIQGPGARGLGEIGIVGTAAAITNAVYHATGMRHRELPLTPTRMIAGEDRTKQERGSV
ncbi:MAG: xanthine dehydrogenase family protein molybdopterin-binding subunit, partial [Armatimonadetes bacterium]|nr:xanthine dehydrogenase family protein molybdopterin-binding subunit [Armatimonadota bacterium]